MKTVELIGDLLHDWVARTLGFKNRHLVPDDLCGTWYAGECSGGINDWEPSINWAQGGPIIERECISLLDPKFCKSGFWEAFIDPILDVRCDDIVGRHEGFGPTPLIAAMRAYVASKFGEEVPDVDMGRNAE